MTTEPTGTQSSAFEQALHQTELVVPTKFLDLLKELETEVQNELSLLKTPDLGESSKNDAHSCSSKATTNDDKCSSRDTLQDEQNAQNAISPGQNFRVDCTCLSVMEYTAATLVLYQRYKKHGLGEWPVFIHPIRPTHLFGAKDNDDAE
jgi:hypothetical protein